jgi:hypothetical protein
VADLRRETRLLLEGLDRWAAARRLCVLNVAGPRASLQLEVYPSAVRLLREWWRPGTRGKDVSQTENGTCEMSAGASRFG